MAIIAALASLLLMSVLGAALVLTTSTEARIAGHFLGVQEALYVADAALEHAVEDLASRSDWDAVLSGATRSGFTDGPPVGRRTLADGSELDLDSFVNLANCGRAAACAPSSLTAVTAKRPWGANNPVWRLFGYGPIAGLLPPMRIDSPYYAVVLVGDDPAENDDDPLRDGDSDTNPGTGVLVLRAEAIGPRGSRQAIEVTVGRPEAGRPGLRVLTWRLTR